MLKTMYNVSHKAFRSNIEDLLECLPFLKA